MNEDYPPLPERPDPDGFLTIKIIGKDVEVNAYRDSTMEIFARACIDADRAARMPAEQERDAARWRYVARFMRLDDIGDDQFCLGLVVNSEELEDRVSEQAARLHHEKSVREWECMSGPEDGPKTLPPVSLASAIDAAMAKDKEQPK